MVYDAVSFELAVRSGLPLATMDADLLKAAGAMGVVVGERMREHGL